MSRNHLIRNNVSRIVRGQDNFSKMTFFEGLDKFQYLTEFATDKWFSCETEFLIFPKALRDNISQVEPEQSQSIALAVA